MATKKTEKLQYRGRPYEATSKGLIYWKPNREGSRTALPLANFNARVIEDIQFDDGRETQRAFRIEAMVAGAKTPDIITVSAAQFALMRWPTENLGAGAIIYPGQAEHTRTAIQMLSRKTSSRRMFQHTGWREIGGEQCYLHAGGAIGSRGSKPVETQLPDALRHYDLPPPPAKKTHLGDAVRASLAMLEVAPYTVTFPLYAAIWRAILGDCQFALHISGPTGHGKSAIAALAQQHFGARMDYKQLPASWLSTANALEGLAFSAKDALLVVDDFVSAGGSQDVSRLHRDADRLIRAQGNAAGRQRMTADAHVRPAKPPRGIIVSTGEEIPKGHSLRARMVLIELAPGEMQWHKLSICQADAAAGRYAAALAGFIRWIAPRTAEAQKLLIDQLAQARSQITADHRRTPDNLAHLAAGFGIFLTFARAQEAISEAEAARLAQESRKAFATLIEAQSALSEQTDPCRRFMRALDASILAFRAHLAPEAGGDPPAELAPIIGWKPAAQAGAWQPAGNRVGWIAADARTLYLDPEACYGAAIAYLRDVGDVLPMTLETLRRRLAQTPGMLASRDEIRKTSTIRRTFDGARREVLHVFIERLVLPELTKLTNEAKSEGQAKKVLRPPGQSTDQQNRSTDQTDQALTSTPPVDSGTYPQLVSLVSKQPDKRPPPREQKKRTEKRRKPPLVLVEEATDPTDQTDQEIPAESAPEIAWPATLRAIRKYFPDCDQTFMNHLVSAPGMEKLPTDEDLAAAIHLAYRPKQTSPGLFLHTVPGMLKRVARCTAPTLQKTTAPPACKLCNDRGYNGRMTTADGEEIRGLDWQTLRPLIESHQLSLCSCHAGDLWRSFTDATGNTNGHTPRSTHETETQQDEPRLPPSRADARPQVSKPTSGR